MALPFSNIVSNIIGGGPNILTQDLAALGLIAPLWGIFPSTSRMGSGLGFNPLRSNDAVVNADNVVGFDYKQDWPIEDYPLEKGAFETYNKVTTPFTVRVTFTSGGSFTNRQKLIDSIAKIAPLIDLYDVVTPEITYLDCNVTHVEYRRSEGRVGLVKVDVVLQQVNQSVKTILTTKTPSGAQIRDDALVSPTPSGPID